MVSGARTGQPIFRSVVRTANAFYSYSQRTAPRRVLAFPAGSRSTRGPAREWRNGRRAGFRCQCPQGRGGSNPPSRTSTTPGLTWGYMESAAGPEGPGWHQGGTDSVRRPWHGMD